jgi:hypothetical protein
MTGPAGGVSGRANDHCKTSGDMLTPRCPNTVLQNAAAHRSQTWTRCATRALMRPTTALAHWTLKATVYITGRTTHSGPERFPLAIRCGAAKARTPGILPGQPRAPLHVLDVG